MRLPSESASSWVHLAFAGFTYSSLVAWAEADILAPATRVTLGDLAAALKVAIERLLKEARETQDAQIFGRPEAQARQNVALTGLRRVTKEALQTVVFRIGDGSENHTNVRTFLPKLISGITKLPLAKRPRAVLRASARLTDLPDFEGKEALVLRLNNAADHAAQMIQAAGDAFAGWQTERSEEVVAKGQLRVLLESTYNALGVAFAGQRGFTETFFLRTGKPSEGDVDEDTGVDDDDDDTGPDTGDTDTGA